MAKKQGRSTVLKVIDAMDHPHGGRILRVRLAEGDPPTKGVLRGARLRAVPPEGEEREVRVLGFPLTWGKTSDARIRESGRVDLHVEEDGAGPPVSLTWTLHLPSAASGR